MTIELDPYQRVTVEIKTKSYTETKSMDLRDAMQLWEDYNSGMTEIMRVTILYPTRKEEA